MTASTIPAGSIAKASRPSSRGLFAGFLASRFFAVFVILIAIVAVWYVGAFLLNAPFQRDLDALNAHYAGLTIEEVRERLKTEVEQLRGEIATLMQAAVQAGSEAMEESQEQVVISGERNLLAVRDFSSDMGSLRRLFDLFEQKTQLMRLLDVSSRAEGVRIYIGGDSMVVPYEELSVVSAPYEVDGQVVGTLGVIGPTRMAYERMIQIVDITSRLVSNALSQK